MSRFRKRPDICNACGFDLSGNTTDRCPHCATKLYFPARIPHPKILAITVGFGIIHFGLMILYALGPELSPLVVYLVDYPVAKPLVLLGVGDKTWLTVSIITCSVLYPIILYGAIWILLRLFRGRTPTDGCPNCGYDLTGNVSGICPECGIGVWIGQRIAGCVGIAVADDGMCVCWRLLGPFLGREGRFPGQIGPAQDGVV